MSSRRSERVSESIRDAIAAMLLREVKDPRVGMVSVTRVVLSDDLRQARVYFSLVGDQDAIDRSIAGMRSASGFMRSQLVRRLQLRYAPELTFVFDPSLAESIHLSTLLRPNDDPDDE